MILNSYFSLLTFHLFAILFVLFCFAATGVNYILYEMLANLGSPGFPSVVYYRLPLVALIFSKQTDDQVIKVQIQNNFPIGDLTQFIDGNDAKFHGTKQSKGNSCLILELAENESDPIIHIPTLVTVSTSSVDETLKTAIKSGICLYLVGPPTHEQILFMEWTRYLNGVNLWYLKQSRFVDDETKAKLLTLPPNKENKNLFEAIVKKMLDIVGPIPLAISDSDKYQYLFAAISQSPTLVAAIDSAKEMNDFNIPPCMKYFMAPYPLKKSEDGPLTPHDAPVCESGLYSWEFLSPTTERVLAEARVSANQYQILKDSGINYKVAESRVKGFILGDFPDKWDWVQDVGYQQYLNTSQLAQPIDFTGVKGLTLLEEEFINQPVDTLTPNRLYHSRAHNFRLGDFVVVDHEKKICYYLQVTLVDLKDHPVKLSVLEKVINRLKIIEKGYKLSLIFVLDRVNRFPTGSKFIIPKGQSKDEVETTLQQLKSDELKCAKRWKDLAKYIETIVVRGSLSNSVESALRSDPKIAPAEGKISLTTSKPMSNKPKQSNKISQRKLVAQFDSMKVVMLKEELRKYNLAVGGKSHAVWSPFLTLLSIVGNKAELIARLVTYLKNMNK